MHNTKVSSLLKKGDAGDTSRSMDDAQKRRVIDLVSKTLPHLPRRMLSSNERNTICFASNLRGDFRATGDMANEQASSSKMPGGGNSHAQHDAGDCGYGIHRESTATTARKLKVRGLKNFMEKRGGGGVPPSWVKEFPCRSRYHPDMYLYNFEEGVLNPKRNTEALSQCQLKGGRCSKCGIYATSICTNCNYCEADCECPNSSFPQPGTESTNQNCPFEPSNNLNPFSGMPSIGSFGATLTKAQQILTSSQNAPRQYPFSTASTNQKPKSVEPHQAPPSPPPQFQVPPYQSYQPYPYGYPPLPYMIQPPPPIYGYAFPPTPSIPIGYQQIPLQVPLQLPQYPPPMYPYPQPFQQQQPLYSNRQQQSVQPSCKTVISVNNDDRM